MLSFKQSAWLKPFIEYNTEQRRLAGGNKFKKDFHKLANNSVFGKTMENLRLRRKIDFVTKPDSLKKLAAQATFKSASIIKEDLVSVERIVDELTLNRPVYSGFCILDISKTLMYDFHYNVIKRNYGRDSKLLFTDTDSLMYQIFTTDIYEDLRIQSDLYDFSEYPIDHANYSAVNAKKIGKMKDELQGELIIEFVGLRSKMYSILHMKTDRDTQQTSQKEIKKAKGVKKCVVKYDIRHENYKTTLLGEMKSFYATMCSIVSKKHQLQSIEMNKQALNSFDDKRLILNDGISTLPYGHYRDVLSK